MFQKLCQWFQGRHTLFIVASMIIGVVLSWFKRLDPNLVTLILGLGGLVFLHSTKEDYFASRGIVPSSNLDVPKAI